MLTAIDKLIYAKNPHLVEGLLKAELAKRDLVVYGARASNLQLPQHLQRATSDYDVLSKKPKKTAREILTNLNKGLGGEYFRLEQAKHKGTYKIKSNYTNETIADITQEKRKPKYKEHLGIKYKKLNSIKRALQKSVKNPKAEFRKGKDLETINRIKLTEEINLW
jgi:hypothetical protein